MRGWARSLVLALATAGGYAAGSLVAWALLDADATPVFFASAGVTSAALVATRRRHWPWILSAVALAELTIDLAHGSLLLTALGLAAANVLEPLTGAVLVRRLAGVPDLSERRDAAAYLLSCVLVAPLVGATVGATTLTLRDGSGWGAAFLPFWAGDALGVLSVGSAILAWVTRIHRSSGTLRHAVVVTGLAVGTAVVTVASFESSRAPFALPLSALFVAALLGGTTGLLTSAAVQGLTANVVSAQGRGPWGDLAGTASPQWATLQLFLAIGVLGPWALAVEQAERRRARAALDADAQEREQARLLLPVTSRLGSALTVEEVARALIDASVPGIASSVTVGLLEEGSARLRVFGSQEPPGQLGLGDRHPISEVVRDGRPVVAPTLVELSDRFPALAPDYRTLGVRSLLVVPVTEHGATIGALALGFARSGAAAGAARGTAESLAALAGPALVRARVQQRDREAAHQLQQALLPTVSADQEGRVRVAVGYRPADPRHEVGGDWYDAFRLPDGRVAVAVGDIVGHDLRAATSMGKLQPALRVAAHQVAEPAEVVQRLDQASTHIEGTMMATVGYAGYDAVGRVLRYSCAGHPPPLLVTGAEARFLDGGRGLPLGLEPEQPRPQGAVVVPDRAVVVWYTDGLVENRAEPIERGLERLRATVLDAGSTVFDDPEPLARRLLEQMGRDRPREDDAVVVCVRL